MSSSQKCHTSRFRDSYFPTTVGFLNRSAQPLPTLVMECCGPHLALSWTCFLIVHFCTDGLLFFVHNLFFTILWNEIYAWFRYNLYVWVLSVCMWCCYNQDFHHAFTSPCLCTSQWTRRLELTCQYCILLGHDRWPLQYDSDYEQ